MIISPYKVNDVVKRRDVSTGNIFTYQNGNGNRYATLGDHDGFFYGFKLKSFVDIASDVSGMHEPIKAVVTPVYSQTVDKMCVIVGYYTLDIIFNNIPEIRTFTSTTIPPFGAVISTPNYVTEDGKPHLFINLGPSVSSDKGISLFPLSEGTEVKLLEFGSLMADRGIVDFITHEQKEKK